MYLLTLQMQHSYLKRPEDFFTSPKESTIIEEIMIPDNLLDDDLIRAMQDWSYLADKIVGEI